MRDSHLTGVLVGTRSSTPSLPSRLMPARTFSCQWSGTGAGTWQATGLLVGGTCSWTGGLCLANVEGQCFVPVKQEFSDFGDILLGGREGNNNLGAGPDGPDGAFTG